MILSTRSCIASTWWNYTRFAIQLQYMSIKKTSCSSHKKVNQKINLLSVIFFNTSDKQGNMYTNIGIISDTTWSFHCNITAALYNQVRKALFIQDIFLWHEYGILYHIDAEEQEMNMKVTCQVISWSYNGYS